MKNTINSFLVYITTTVAVFSQAPVVDLRSSGGTAIISTAEQHALYTRTPYISIYSVAAGTGTNRQEGVRGEVNGDAFNPNNQYVGVTGLGKNATPLSGTFTHNIGVFGSGKHGVWGKASESNGYGIYGDGHTGVLGVSNTGGIGVHGISYGGGYAGSFIGNVSISERLGIGLSGGAPDFLLDVGGRVRLRSGGTDETSAGVWFNNNLNNSLRVFVGMRVDNEFGFYTPLLNQWLMRFNVTTGSICAFSTIANCSDQRLKTDFVVLKNSLHKVSLLQSFNYHWIKQPQMGLQTGLIAQEVQKIFPELVQTDDEGYLAINYVGLIPHLLEAIKDLKNQIEAHRTTGETLLEMNKDLKATNEKNEARLNAIESALKQLTTPSETAGK